MLFGHADETGAEPHNKVLSQRRAKAMLALEIATGSKTDFDMLLVTTRPRG